MYVTIFMSNVEIGPSIKKL